MQTFLASAVMAAAAADLNDAGQGSFTNAILLPHIKSALRALATEFLVRGLSYTRQTTGAPALLTAGTSTLAGTLLQSTYPGFIEPIKLYEATNGSYLGNTQDPPWRSMNQVEFLPNRQSLDYFYEWAYYDSNLNFIAASNDIRVKIDYLKDLTIITAASDSIDIPGSFLYLQKKTAALAAMYIGENESRAQILAAEAAAELEKCITINLRPDQGIPAVRKPWRGKTYGRNRYRTN